MVAGLERDLGGLHIRNRLVGRLFLGCRGLGVCARRRGCERYLSALRMRRRGAARPREQARRCEKKPAFLRHDGSVEKATFAVKPGCNLPGPSRRATLTPMADTKRASAYPADVYETFDGFMHQVVKDVYEGGAKRAEFVALVIASGELLPMAWGRMKKTGVKELAMGTAGIVALRFGLKYLLGGPLGLVLTAFTAATLVSFFWSNQKDVMRRVKPYKEAIRDSRAKFEDVQTRYQEGRYDDGERALLVEGLLRRLVSDIEAPVAEAAKVSEDEAAT